jgi:putative transcriptional regulator
MINGYEKLAKKREEKGFTYQDMAEKLGISKCYYWQLEHKKRRLYYDLAKRIALILETKPDELFYEETNE